MARHDLNFCLNGGQRVVAPESDLAVYVIRSRGGGSAAIDVARHKSLRQANRDLE